MKNTHSTEWKNASDTYDSIDLSIPPRGTGEYQPISSSLVLCLKLVEEGTILRDRTLSYEGGTVCPVRLQLADTMPVL